MSSTQVLAFDLGASNGRAIVGDYSEGKIKLHEVHRFSNDPVKLNNYIYWDFPRLFHELKTSLVKAKNQGFNIQSVGIDTWGVDYGLIDEDGELIGNPVHYRDERAIKGMNKLLATYDKQDLKKRTGMDCVSYNTVNQLINDKQLKKAKVQSMLNMPDLFNYFLTGKMASEFSMVTTTQLYNYETNDWNKEFISELSLDNSIFNTIIPSGTIVGNVKEDILNELKINPLKVVSVTSHDTASAVRAIPTDEEDILFIATGTWIIVGSKQKTMTMNQKVMDYDLTNEGGKYPNVNLLKNHVGLWMLQESKRYWEKEGIEIGFGDMVEQGKKAIIDSYINISDPRFFEPGNMPKKVFDYCKETSQKTPTTIGETVRIIEQSLAKQIAQTLFEIEQAVDKKYDAVHIFGGGVQDSLLCELIEFYSKKKVIIGAKEATTFGNVIDQFIALSTFKESDRINVLKASL
ncbi:MAG: rhamnulokinase [Vallitalea sp.]|jgi:rhamnulokinase/L-fuculokinase|nr:rhamnulokinase [Vallitalea sp.]